jgi:hypothetical protein
MFLKGAETMVAGYHLIWTAYGWWLPNDPRGSTSQQVLSVQLQYLGELHFGRESNQYDVS